MNDLRSEIRAAFEKDQAAHPPAANLRHQVVRAAARQPRRELNLQWLAVAAALVIGALVVVSLMSTRLAGRSPVPSRPVGQNRDYGAPPAGVPLIYLAVPNHDGWFTGFDWTGKPRGTVKVGSTESGLAMAPDGQSFATGIGAKGGNWQFLDRLGKPVASGSLPGAYSTMWADDNRHLCALTQDPQSLAYSLWTLQPGQQPRSVSEVARDTNLGQTSLGLVACSFAGDSAIVVRTNIAWVTEAWIVRLSNGKILAHHDYVAAAVETVVATRDARYIAETSTAATGAGPTSAPVTQIRRVADWAAVASFDHGYTVLAFSGDGTSVLVRTLITQQGTPSHLAIFKWKEGGSPQTLWQYTGSEDVATFIGQPSADGFALSFVVPGQEYDQWCAPGMAGCTTYLSVMIVHGDGSTAQIPDRYNTTW
jgi:hypothetical protein